MISFGRYLEASATGADDAIYYLQIMSPLSEKASNEVFATKKKAFAAAGAIIARSYGAQPPPESFADRAANNVNVTSYNGGDFSITIGERFANSLHYYDVFGLDKKRKDNDSRRGVSHISIWPLPANLRLAILSLISMLIVEHGENVVINRLSAMTGISFPESEYYAVQTSPHSAPLKTSYFSTSNKKPYYLARTPSPHEAIVGAINKYLDELQAPNLPEEAAKLVESGYTRRITIGPKNEIRYIGDDKHFTWNYRFGLIIDLVSPEITAPELVARVNLRTAVNMVMTFSARRVATPGHETMTLRQVITSFMKDKKDAELADLYMQLQMYNADS